jgi:hypothetical protein
MFNHTQISALHKIYLQEQQPYQKTVYMVETLKAVVKTFAAIVVSEYAKHHQLSFRAAALMVQGMRSSSIDNILVYSKVLFDELNNKKHNWTVPEFNNDFQSLERLLSDVNIGVFLFINDTENSARISLDKCREDLVKYEPYLYLLLQLNTLNSTFIDEQEGKVFLHYNQEQLSLHPFMFYQVKGCAPSFVFANDVKTDLNEFIDPNYKPMVSPKNKWLYPTDEFGRMKRGKVE